MSRRLFLQERRKGGEGGFVFQFRSKESSSRTNIHAATEDLSSTITLKRVKTQRVRETRRRNFAFKKVKKSSIYTTMSLSI